MGEGGCDKVVFTIYVFDHSLYFTSNSFSFYGTHGHVLSSLDFALLNIFGAEGGRLHASIGRTCDNM